MEPTERSQAIQEALLEAISELNQTLGPDRAIPPSGNTVIFGPISPLDSLGLITLLATTEEKLEARLGKALSLMDLLPEGGETLTVAAFAHAITESTETANP